MRIARAIGTLSHYSLERQSLSGSKKRLRVGLKEQSACDRAAMVIIDNLAIPMKQMQTRLGRE
jgi:hypothetical protein